jgi:hypothetical protein
MDVYVVVLRIIHIAAAVFWVGAAYLFFLFVQPTAKALGPDGGKFMTHLLEQKKVPVVILGSAGTAIVAGLLLYWRASGGFDLDWVTSATGLAFTIGGVSAIVAFLFGLFIVKPAADRMGALAREIAASGGAPSQAQAAQMGATQAKLRAIGITNLVLLAITVVTMAVARYL